MQKRLLLLPLFLIVNFLRANPPAVFNTGTPKFDCNSSEANIIAAGAARLEFADGSRIYTGTRQTTSINQDPIVVRFNANGTKAWCLANYETTGADGRGIGLFWTGQELYGVFSTDGTQGTTAEDYRRFTGSGWLKHYTDASTGGGGPKVAIILRLDPATGEGMAGQGTFITARNSSGQTNSLAVKNLYINTDGHLVVRADSWFSPRRTDRTAMTQTGTGGSPHDYTLVLSRNLTTAHCASAVGWNNGGAVCNDNPCPLQVSSIADNGPNTLRAAIACAPTGGVISFSAQLAGQTINLASTLEVPAGKNLTIDANAAPGLSISGNNTVRVFLIRSASVTPTQVNLKGLRIVNGVTSEYGGGIRTEHQALLTVENCTFENNRATQGGSAIFNHFEGTSTLRNCVFANNNATAGNSEQGATVMLWGPRHHTISGCTFRDNQAINGGGINGLNSRLTIEDCRFINNNTTAAFYDTGKPNPFLRGFGAAIYADRASAAGDANGGSITLRRCYFEGNIGEGEGGACYLYTGTNDQVLVEDCSFVRNESRALNGGGSGGTGGAIVQMNNGVNRGFVVRRSLFAGNRAGVTGGAVRVQWAPTTIENCTFHDNRALQVALDGFSANGGALAFFDVGSSEVNLLNNTFANNSAGWVGGAVMGPSSIRLRNNIFFANTAFNGGNNWRIQQHSSNEMTDLGGNIQFPAKFTNNFNDFNVSASVHIADPLLQPLALNGGISATMALGVGSPAIDRGANCPTTDQRGFNRTGTCDAGAFEVGATASGSTTTCFIQPMGLVGVSWEAASQTLTKTAASGWNNATTRSAEVLPANADGWVEWEVPAITPTFYMAGLADAASNGNWAAVDYGIYYAAGQIYVYHTSTGILYTGRIAQAGDRLRVWKRGDRVNFYHNGTALMPFYDYPVNPATPLSFDVSFFSNGASLRNPVSSFCLPAPAAPCNLAWANVAGATFNAANNTLTKTSATGWGNAGATSAVSLPANADGGISWTIPTGPLDQTFYMLGLSQSSPDNGWASIQHGIYYVSGQIYVYLSGANQGFYGTVQPGDRLSVLRTGGTVNFYRNNKSFFGAPAPAATPLIADLAMFSSGARVQGLQGHNLCAGAPLAAPLATRAEEAPVFEAPRLTVYPNPTTGRFTVALGNLGRAELSVLDVLGREVLRQTAEGPLNSLDLTAQPVGTYFVRAKAEGFVRTVKVMRE
jgi:hypothetical protein